MQNSFAHFCSKLYRLDLFMHRCRDGAGFFCLSFTSSAFLPFHTLDFEHFPVRFWPGHHELRFSTHHQGFLCAHMLWPVLSTGSD